VKDKTSYEFGCPAPSESDIDTALLYQHTQFLNFVVGHVNLKV